MLLHGLLVLEELLDRVTVGHVSPLLGALAPEHPVLPGLEVRELVDVDTGPAGVRDPPPVHDVGDGDVVADEVPGLGGGEVLVEHAVEASRLVDVAVDAILDALGGVAREVVRLSSIQCFS